MFEEKSPFATFVQSCYRAARILKTMNVTLKLPDDLVRQARHHAIEEDKSLSAWMADLVRRELENPELKTDEPKSLYEAMQTTNMPDWFYDKEFPLPDRKADKEREFSFDPNEG